jgi:predicted RNase H-like nuclease
MTVAEVYPHPAMVRMFGIPRIVKYKKGSVVERRKEFRRLQRLLKRCLKKKFPKLAIDAETRALLAQRWSKPVEDRTDAFFCALIGLWHWMHRGRKSEVIGDGRRGFILLPAAD